MIPQGDTNERMPAKPFGSGASQLSDCAEVFVRYTRTYDFNGSQHQSVANVRDVESLVSHAPYACRATWAV